MHPLQERLTTEDTVEKHLRLKVKALGGLCIKLNPFGYAGIPDRLVLLPRGRIAFYELKRPVGGQYEPLQLRWHAKLRRLGFTVHVCRTKQQVDDTLEDV